MSQGEESRLFEARVEGQLVAEHVERRLRGNLSRNFVLHYDVPELADLNAVVPVLDIGPMANAYCAITQELLRISSTSNRIVRALLDAHERDLLQHGAKEDRHSRALELQEHAIDDLRITLEERDQAIAELRTSLNERERNLTESAAERQMLREALEQRDEHARELQTALSERERDLAGVISDRNQLKHTLQLREQAIAELPAASENRASQIALPAFHSSIAEAWPTPDSEQALDQFLTASEPPVGATESDKLYTSLELVLRGSEELIRERQSQYLPVLEVPDGIRELPVLDLGCGRGEFLALLRERDIPAVGVDLNASDIQRLRDSGYDVHHTDAVAYLETLPDASLSGIAAFQVIEHLQHDYLRRLLKLAHAKLAVNGFLLLETPNPDCLTAFRYFYLDPTHVKPIPKYLLAILLRFYGFEELTVLYQSPVTATIDASDADWSRYYQAYAMLSRKLGGRTKR